MFFAMFTEYFTVLDIKKSKYLQVLQISIPIRNILRHHFTLAFPENVKTYEKDLS